jgi:hypothetical protein
VGKFKGQLSGAPTVVIDGVVAAIEQNDYERVLNDSTKRWENGARKGRVLGVQTAGLDPERVPDLEAVKVPASFDGVPFEVGQRVLINCEVFYGDYGVSWRFAGFVNPNQVDTWKGVIGAQQRAAQAA